MNTDYEDIRNRIAEPPKWFDEHAVPRYCDFHPSESADIYADEVALVLITCQSCDHVFHVAFSSSTGTKMSAAMRFDRKSDQFKAAWNRTLADDIRRCVMHYGDPPNIQCCAAGPTMNSEPRVVLQYWERLNNQREWRRDAALEIPIEPDWVNSR